MLIHNIITTSNDISIGLTILAHIIPHSMLNIMQMSRFCHHIHSQGIELLEALEEGVWLPAQVQAQASTQVEVVDKLLWIEVGSRL